MERKGVEPSTSALRTQRSSLVTDSPTGFVTPLDFGCTTGCTNSPENECGEAVGELVSSNADASLLKARESRPIKVGLVDEAGSVGKAESFSAGLMLIASLPLSDAEKAEAVRRLMAERDGSKR